MEFVRLEERGAVALLVIDRPKALNALNSQVLRELNEALDAIDTDRIRAVVLTGGGDKAFVAGADIAEMEEMSALQAENFGLYGNRLMRRIEQFRVPVIAAVNGFALGGGNELAMSCDIRIAAENAVFGQPEVGLGITPGFGGTQRLARVIGSMSLAKELIYSARNIKAAEALQIGLVSRVVPQEELLDTAFRLAIRIADQAPIAVAHSKKAINEGVETNLDAGIRLEAQLFGACFATQDQKEGMRAFLEKRKEKEFRNR